MCNFALVIFLIQYSSSILPNILINKEFISLPNLIIFASFGLWMLRQLIFNKDLKKIPDLYFYLFFYRYLFIQNSQDSLNLEMMYRLIYLHYLRFIIL